MIRHVSVAMDANFDFVIAFLENGSVKGQVTKQLVNHLDDLIVDWLRFGILPKK